jgi:hypothetical protein
MSPLRTRSNSSAWIAIVSNPHETTQLAERFPRTIRLGQPDQFLQVSNLHHPVSPAGITPESAIFQLGHGGRELMPVTQLTPSMLRQLRELAHMCRRHHSILHLFGIIDSTSPYGSRSMFEHVIRLLRPASISIHLHVGVWHPTPKDFEQGLQELRSLCQDRIQLASVFPVSFLQLRRAAGNYVDSILHPETVQPSMNIALPLHHPHILSMEESTPNDCFLILNHELHGFDSLTEAIGEATQNPGHSLQTDHPVSSNAGRILDHSKHILAISNQPNYITSYFGTNMNHPYFESLVSENSTHVLEMLISPHFEYAHQPDWTIILLDEAAHSDFDWLLASYIKQHQDNPYICLFLDPYDLNDDWLMTNHAVSQPDYATLSLHD